MSSSSLSGQLSLVATVYPFTTLVTPFSRDKYRCTTISWRCLQNTYNVRFMSTNINQRSYIILNLGYCRVFAETFSAKTRQHPRFKIMYRLRMCVDIKRMLYTFTFCKQRQLIVVHLYDVSITVRQKQSFVFRAFPPPPQKKKTQTLKFSDDYFQYVGKHIWGPN